MSVKKSMSGWWESRHIPWLLWGIPALLSLLMFLALYIYRTEWNPLTVHDRYAAVKKTAMAQGDYRTARIACERALEITRADAYFKARYPEHLFDLAICLINLGRPLDARHLINTVAPFDTAESAYSYPPAHLYMAKLKWLETKERTPELIAQVERHLLRAATDEPDMAEAHQMLGELYLSRKDWEKAKRHLLKAADQRGDAYLLLALVSQGTNDPEGMRQWNGRAQQYYQQRLGAAPKEDTRMRMGLARTYLLAEEYEKAADTFLVGYKRSGDPVYTGAIGAVYGNWVEALKRKKAPAGEVLKRISQGLTFDNRNEILLMELVRLSKQSGEAGEEASKAVQSMLAAGSSNGMLHFVLGVASLEKNDEAGAAAQFDLAFKESPELPQIANNFAMALAFGAEPDLKRAMTVIEQLLVRYPNLPAALDTRGRIHLKLGDFSAAVVDLNAALPQLPGYERSIHTALAEAYDGLKLSELAKQHRELAKPQTPGAAVVP